MQQYEPFDQFSAELMTYSCREWIGCIEVPDHSKSGGGQKGFLFIIDNDTVTHAAY